MYCHPVLYVPNAKIKIPSLLYVPPEGRKLSWFTLWLLKCVPLLQFGRPPHPFTSSRQTALQLVCHIHVLWAGEALQHHQHRQRRLWSGHWHAGHEHWLPCAGRSIFEHRIHHTIIAPPHRVAPNSCDEADIYILAVVMNKLKATPLAFGI